MNDISGTNIFESAIRLRIEYIFSKKFLTLLTAAIATFVNMVAYGKTAKVKKLLSKTVYTDY